ncbi:phage late control D family protein [Pantoea sp. Mb-10]|uniref:phage late control D family protein n=1 Tax=unclassified Pantoea TaxID=2630326 RepID=UPI001E3654AF|nr:MULTISPECIES: phage late control D family protein [unclassified Pantoea]MCE0489947.1 phage late control D family protein [Pantoea sp. Mb-10]MCE0500946.1 phage late control D family protein [Pantoea sp. Pb-8]
MTVPAGRRFTPDYTLRVNDKNVTANVKARLISLTLTDNRGFEADQLDLVLDDADGTLALPVRGAAVILSLGWQGETLTDKGRFIVDEVAHHGVPDTLTIRARSADFGGLLNQSHSESYHMKTLSDIVAQLAARNGLIPNVSKELANIGVGHIDQSNETDAQFMTRLATLFGAIAAIKAGQLLFMPPGKGVTASGKAIMPLALTRQETKEYSFSIADRSNYSGVSATWLHTKDPTPHTLTMQRKPAAASSPTLTHPAAKKSASDATQASGTPDADYLAGSRHNLLVLPKIYPDRATAMRAAKAKWEMLQRGTAEFSVTLAWGRADVYPETPVRVSGFKSVIDTQPWIIKKVTHNLSAAGYTTKLDLEMDISGRAFSLESDSLKTK